MYIRIRLRVLTQGVAPYLSFSSPDDGWLKEMAWTVGWVRM